MSHNTEQDLNTSATPTNEGEAKKSNTRLFAGIAIVVLVILLFLLVNPFKQNGSTAAATPDAGAQNAPPLSDAQVLGTAAVLMTATERAQPTASPTYAPCGASCQATPAPVSGNAQAAAPAILSTCSVQGVEKVDFYLNPGDLSPIPNASIYAGSVDSTTVITVTGEQNGWVRVNAANLAVVDANGVTTGHLNAGGWIRPNTGLVCGGSTSQEAIPTQENMVTPGATPTLFVPGS